MNFFFSLFEMNRLRCRAKKKKKPRDFNLTNERTACINCITIDGIVTHFIINFDTNSIRCWIGE